MREIAPESVPLARGLDPELIGKLTEMIWQAVSDAYPIRGRVYSGDDGPEIDVGSAVGVNQDMRFDVFAQPDVKYRLPGRSVIVEGPVGTEYSKVKLEGFNADDIPADGWYVEEEEAQS